MTSSDTILERMMTLHPKVIDLTLDRVHRLLAATGHPERALPPVIHVAGTNGKGSTVAMLRAGIEGAGQTAHVYTSPHLARFNERIRVAGRLIAEADLTEVLDEAFWPSPGHPPTGPCSRSVSAVGSMRRTSSTSPRSPSSPRSISTMSNTLAKR